MIKILLDSANNVTEATTQLLDEEKADWLEVEEPQDFWGDPFHWKYVDEQFVYDTESVEQEETEAERQTSIAMRKQYLANSDYKIMKFAESLLEVDSITDFLALIIRTRQELREIVRQRSEWRKQINNLEDEFKDDTKND